jgi:NodT family efflux transporter outer membrane factor (OMF) lipoprotein
MPLSEWPRAIRAGFLAGTVGLGLSGCTLDSGNPPLSPPLPQAFEAPAPAGAPVWPAPEWWSGFNSRELNALVADAQRANPDLGAAAARVAQADAQVRIAGATLIPIIDLTADVSRSRSAQLGGNRSRTSYNTTLSASYEIDFWGRNRAQLQSAQAIALASRFDQQTVAISILASVANSYFLIVGLQDRLRIAQENVASAEQVLAAIRARLAVGTATALSVAQQESIVAQQRAVIPALQQQLRQTANAVAILTGRLPEGFAVRGGSFDDLSIPPVAPGLPPELLTRRPDVQSAEAQLAAANADIVAARAAFFPRVTLGLDAGFQSQALASIFGPGGSLYSVGIGAAQPLLQIYGLQGTLDQRRGQYAELLENYRKSVISAFGDVENALVATQQTAESVRLQGEVVDVARRAYVISQAQLRAGTVDIINVLTTQQTLFQALDAQAQARLARLQAAVGLFQAMGGGWTASSMAARPIGR